MTWEPELEELHQRERLAEQLGGADKVERQHHFGKLTIRERIDQVVDEGSFWEMGKAAGVATYDDEGNLIEFMPSNFVFGIANLDGRPAVVSGDDFTVRGGSNDASISAKREASETIAAEMRLPHVRLLDGMSGGGSVKTISNSGNRSLIFSTGNSSPITPVEANNRSLVLIVSFVPFLFFDSFIVKTLDKFFASISMLSFPCFPVNVFAFLVLTNNPLITFL